MPGSQKIYRCLQPLAWLYGAGVDLRNKFFDWGILRSKSFPVPVVCIGNLAVGGTGKTPHTEYLIRLLTAQGLQVATLSRGYKRKTRGYLLAGDDSTARQIGDEPKQMKEKFPHIRVAVDEDRCHGIEQLMKPSNPPVDVILLDDAYQHRYVKPGLTILLTDYHRLFVDDALLPAGRLREPSRGKERAQVVVVTKCPDTIKPIEFKIIADRLNLFPYQKLYFSRFCYGRLTPLFPHIARELTGNEEVLLLTGIASPTPLLEEVKKRAKRVELLSFADHHHFSDKDYADIARRFLQLEEGNRIVITTEKDATRLADDLAGNRILAPHIYVLPIEIEILQNRQEIFNQNIIDYVRQNPRDRSFPEGKDANPS